MKSLILVAALMLCGCEPQLTCDHEWNRFEEIKRGENYAGDICIHLHRSCQKCGYVDIRKSWSK